MLITTCSHCQARFRVTPQQLNAKQGQVRCGRCHKVFSGFGALERFPDDDTGARLLAAREAEERTDAPAEARAAPVDLHGTIESVDDPPAAGAQAERPAAPPEPPEPPQAREPRRRRAFRGASPELVLEDPEPAPPPSRLWSVGVVVLALTLAAMLVHAYRGPLAQHYPALRPGLEAACAQLGCAVPWSREHAQLKLEESELLEVPGRPGEIALGARIRNLATVSQEYPYLELTLTDLSGQAAARRVLRPTDYLGRPLAPGEVLAPGVEVALQLRLATPNIKATGYELLLFYP
jgi:predicted Zn finger-like uncharacterized protein